MAYYEQPFDRSRSTARLSDLARLRADVLAQAELQSGFARANAMQNAMTGVGATIADLARIKAEQPARDRAAAEQRRADNAREVMRLAGQADPADAARMLRGEGMIAEAEHIEDRATREKDRERALKNEGLNALYRRFDAASTVAGKGAVLLSEAQRDPSLWPEIRPLVTDLAAQVAPQLAEFVPQDNNPEAIGALLASATQMAENHAKAAAALKAIDVGLATPKKLAEAQKGVAQLLSTAQSAEQWDGMAQALGTMGVPEALVTSFGGFSPESVQRAAAVARGEEKGTPGSTEQQHLEAFARARGKSVAQLTPGEMTAARASWTAAGREPGGDPNNPFSQNSRNTVERWYLSAKSDLDQNRTFMDPQDYERARAELDASYRRQMMLPPEAALNVERPAPGSVPLSQQANGTRNVPASLADLARPASPMGTAAPAAAAPRPQVMTPAQAAPPAAQPMTPDTPSGGQSQPAPPAVVEALKNANIGEYELSDGSVWRVLAVGQPPVRVQ